MQHLCFYRFSASGLVSGNAEPLLLPFFSFWIAFGQCSTAAFTVFHLLAWFRVMQHRCFYRFSAPAWFPAMQHRCFYRFSAPGLVSGNAGH
jgi:hypothetical protein